MPSLPSLSEWESFYVIVGSSAAGLTGLMFVVVTLSAERTAEDASAAYEAFASPTIGHFSMVLLIAALLTRPRHTALTLEISLVIPALAGIIYVIRVISKARRQKAYVPELEDWIYHCVLPLLAYVLLFVAALLVRIEPEIALNLVAAVAAGLLFIGIHNAWDSALYIATMPRGSK